MNTLLPFNLQRFASRALVTLGFIIISNSAHAVFIDFDDIPYIPVDPEWPQFYDVPLSDQYADKGLLIDGGYLASYHLDSSITKSRPNFLLGSHFLSLTFTGDLPTFVGMYVSAFFEEPLHLNAYNSAGLIETKSTKGPIPGGPNYNYTPKQYISFTNEAGISSVTLEYSNRVSGAIDDLTFTRKTSVVEPSSIILLALGIFGILARKMRFN